MNDVQAVSLNNSYKIDTSLKDRIVNHWEIIIGFKEQTSHTRVCFSGQNTSYIYLCIEEAKILLSILFHYRRP